MIEEVRHFVLETKDLGTFDVVEYKEYLKQKEEIERLNNIINKLEEYINEKNKIKVETDGYIWQIKRPAITCKDLKNKLQELKGEDKE